MFTGIVETIGTVVSLRPRRGSSRLAVRSSLPLRRMKDGDSVAVDGVCLTVAARAGSCFEADVVAETLARSTLGALGAGRRVNLERAVGMGEPLGGHLVQGHVDATARVVEVVRRGDDWRLRVELLPGIRRYVAEKGSIALQGVSLTVARVTDAWLEVALVPQTRERTTLGGARTGEPLNVEVDLLARYLETLMDGRAEPTGRARAPARRAGSRRKDAT